MDNESSKIEAAVAPNAMDKVAEMIDLDEPDFLLELLDTFLVESERLITNLEQEWLADSRDQVLLIAHSLKSSCATFHALPLSKLAETLENELRDGGKELDVPAHITKMMAEYERIKPALELERVRIQARLGTET